MGNSLSGWPILLSVASPFILALAFVGKYLISRLDASEQEKKDLYQKVIGDFLPAVASATTAINANTAALTDVLEFVRDLKDELAAERELRIRFEERFRMVEEGNPPLPVVRGSRVTPKKRA